MEPRLERDCAVEATVAVLSGKWKPIILFHLMNGPKNYSDLPRLLEKASDRMISHSLRELVQDGLVAREVAKTQPVRVTYSLTEMGVSLVPVLAAMSEWGAKRQKENSNSSVGE